MHFSPAGDSATRDYGSGRYGGDPETGGIRVRVLHAPGIRTRAAATILSDVQSAEEKPDSYSGAGDGPNGAPAGVDSLDRGVSEIRTGGAANAAERRIGETALVPAHNLLARHACYFGGVW